MKLKIVSNLDTLIALRQFWYDAIRYRRLSGERDSAFDKNNAGINLEAQITKDYHRIEKGLALAEPKHPFGEEVRDRLSRLIPLAEIEAPTKPYVSYASDAVSALDDWNLNREKSDKVSPNWDKTSPTLTDDQISDFFESRRSVRNFDTNRVPSQELINNAVRLASNTPSVCNRQAARVHLYSGQQATIILGHQNGNAGFRNQIPVVAVVTVDTRLFLGTAERNQRWVDGSLFAMTFTWALHAYGIQTCMLNWSRNNNASDLLRSAGNIDPSEDVIMLIAIGYGNDGFRVARSERRDLQEIVDWHE